MSVPFSGWVGWLHVGVMAMMEVRTPEPRKDEKEKKEKEKENV